MHDPTNTHHLVISLEIPITDAACFVGELCGLGVEHLLGLRA